MISDILRNVIRSTLAIIGTPIVLLLIFIEWLCKLEYETFDAWVSWFLWRD